MSLRFTLSVFCALRFSTVIVTSIGVACESKARLKSFHTVGSPVVSSAEYVTSKLLGLEVSFTILPVTLA